MAKWMRTVLAAVGLAVLPGAVQAGGSAWDYSFIAIDGQPLPLKQFEGKAVLVVNTASQCGFTPQYKALLDLAEKYRERGLVIIGVPSNDFGAQEPGSSTDIKEFCVTNYGINFPLTEKTKVSGDDAHPFYRWAVQNLGVVARPMWNFHKYLIAPDGRIVDWFSSVTKPDSARVINAIEAVLPVKS